MQQGDGVGGQLVLLAGLCAPLQEGRRCRTPGNLSPRLQWQSLQRSEDERDSLSRRNFVPRERMPQDLPGAPVRLDRVQPTAVARRCLQRSEDFGGAPDATARTNELEEVEDGSLGGDTAAGPARGRRLEQIREGLLPHEAGESLRRRHPRRGNLCPGPDPHQGAGTHGSQTGHAGKASQAGGHARYPLSPLRAVGAGHEHGLSVSRGRPLPPLRGGPGRCGGGGLKKIPQERGAVLGSVLGGQGVDPALAGRHGG